MLLLSRSVWCLLLILCSHILPTNGSRNFRNDQRVTRKDRHPPNQRQQSQQIRQRKEICNTISYKLLFSNQNDADIYHHLYDCFSLMHFKYKREKEKEQHKHFLQHVKCHHATLGRFAAEQWCRHVRVQRIFASPTQQSAWDAAKCGKWELSTGVRVEGGNVTGKNSQQTTTKEMKRKSTGRMATFRLK